MISKASINRCAPETLPNGLWNRILAFLTLNEVPRLGHLNRYFRRYLYKGFVSRCIVLDSDTTEVLSQWKGRDLWLRRSAPTVQTLIVTITERGGPSDDLANSSDPLTLLQYLCALGLPRLVTFKLHIQCDSRTSRFRFFKDEFCLPDTYSRAEKYFFDTGGDEGGTFEHPSTRIGDCRVLEETKSGIEDNWGIDCHLPALQYLQITGVRTHSSNFKMRLQAEQLRTLATSACQLRSIRTRFLADVLKTSPAPTELSEGDYIVVSRTLPRGWVAVTVGADGRSFKEPTCYWRWPTTVG